MIVNEILLKEFEKQKNINKLKIEEEKIIIITNSSKELQKIFPQLIKTKKEKFFDYLKNSIYLILFCIVSYLGTPNNSNGARYESEKTRSGIHK